MVEEIEHCGVLWGGFAGLFRTVGCLADCCWLFCVMLVTMYLVKR